MSRRKALEALAGGTWVRVGTRHWRHPELGVIFRARSLGLTIPPRRETYWVVNALTCWLGYPTLREALLSAQGKGGVPAASQELRPPRHPDDLAADGLDWFEDSAVLKKL